ncbi:MAG: adenylate/guanylate cyclase domain-containing protein [Bacteriovoracaceae bacterium]|nr:adenylate/guanylate cyclase domain-containing protein [Bacteriovoracaceae bacterium]
MKNNFFKTFYFIFAVFMMLVCSTLYMYLETNQGHYGYSFIGKIAQGFERLENALIDQKFRVRENRLGDKRVVVVAIDEKSLQQLGRWQSWGRENYGRMVAKLAQYGTKVIGFDVVFDQEDHNKGYQSLIEIKESYQKHHPKANSTYLTEMEQGIARASTDWMLIDEIKNFQTDPSRSVILGYYIDGATTFVEQKISDIPDNFRFILRTMIPYKSLGPDLSPEVLKKTVSDFGVSFPALSKATNNHGYFSMNPDSDGVIRDYRLVMQMYGQVFPSLSLKMIESYWKENVLLKQYQDGTLGLEFNKRQFQLPLASDGTTKINYYGPQNSFITVSLSDVINDESEIEYFWGEENKAKKILKTELFQDSLVLVGATAIGIFDVRNTPKQVNLPGVEIHASLLSQFLENAFIYQPSIEMVIQMLGFLLITVLMISYLIYKSGAVFSLLGMLMSLLLVGVGDYYYLFLNSKLSFVTPIYLCIIITYLVENTFRFLTEEKEKQRIKNTFKQYVSADVVQKMLEEPGAIKLGGESRYLTILFSDIEGFTTISEKLSPEKLAQVLNIYLTEMSEIVFKNKGTLDKFIGDAIMCFWGAPIEEPNQVFLACKTAIEMQRKNEQLKKRIYEEFGVLIKTRIGINSGTAAVGNMGSQTQFAYTVLGDTVNLAARLEGINKEYGTFTTVSEFTYEKIKDKFLLRKLDLVAVKGKEIPVTIYELIDYLDECDSSMLKRLDLFNDGLKAYFSKDFKLAAQKFSHPDLKDDACARIYEGRCHYFLQNPPEVTWNGVWIMHTK